MKRAWIIVIFSTFTAACTQTTTVGQSSLDRKYGGMDASKGAVPVQGGNAMQGSGNVNIPWKGFKAY